jgi:hypothetical protein
MHRKKGKLAHTAYMAHANTTRHVNRYLEKSRRKTKGALNEDEEAKAEDSTYRLPKKKDRC